MKDFTAVCIFFLAFSFSALSASSNLVEWSTEESVRRLARSQYKSDFFILSNHFESQSNKFYCALASSAIVLNSLFLRNKDEIPEAPESISSHERDFLPDNKKFSPFFKKYTQFNILNKETKSKVEVLGKPLKIKGKEQKDYGVQLRQLAKILEANGAKVEVRVVSEKSDLTKMKNEILKNLQNKNDFVLVNYARKSLGQKGGGHVSPIGAYDKESDSFLVMDVNPNKAPWVWVKSKDLMSAMKTFDTVENRGYLLIQK